MLTATCHCGAIKVTVPRKPRTITDCNCSICTKYGVLWAYYKESTVQVEAKAKTTHEYIWGRKHQRFVRCAGCGCRRSTSPASGRRTATTTTAIRGENSAIRATELATCQSGQRDRRDAAREDDPL